MAHPVSLVRCPRARRPTITLSTGSYTITRRGAGLQSGRGIHKFQSPSPSPSPSRDGSRRARSAAPRWSPSPVSASSSTTTTAFLSRQYHSQYHPDLPPHEYTNSQTTILSAALDHVPEHGFTLQALTLGARDTGFLDVSVQLLPRGEFDLILFWLASRRGLLRAKVENGLFDRIETASDAAAGPTTPTPTSLPHHRALSVEEKTKILIMERLRMNEKIKHQWQDALALMSFPSHIPLSLSELHALSSDILTLAGDASVDAAWYTKRLSVAAIYASAEVVMTRDTSPRLSETEAFVVRRVEDMDAIGAKLSGIKACVGFMGSTAVGLGRSWGLKI